MKLSNCEKSVCFSRCRGYNSGMEKRCYNIEALNKYGILIPTAVNPEIVVNVLAAIIAQEQGISMNYALKKYEKQIRMAAIVQYEDPRGDQR